MDLKKIRKFLEDQEIKCCSGYYREPKIPFVGNLTKKNQQSIEKYHKRINKFQENLLKLFEIEGTNKYDKFYFIFVKYLGYSNEKDIEKTIIMVCHLLNGLEKALDPKYTHLEKIDTKWKLK